ncbi:P-loop ATPase, Sll1717 family [Terasakiella pusilla]|uniref:P-loop ATPase, Sll1717 family n=1 Tax=Terasakiella pusilla TaxID=64973 RepID=UPI00048FB8E1|nr:hypothetical protein [Terasakiella pusilla]
MFKKIEFGYADASNEALYQPRLINEGYYDHKNALSHARFKPDFLFLGNKGAGKSILGEKLENEAAHDPEFFVKRINLEDFPFKTFDKLSPSKESSEATYPSAWAWLLLISVMDSIQQDESMAQGADFSETFGTLRSVGLLPDANIRRIIEHSSKRTFSLDILKTLKITEEGNLPDAIGRMPMLEDHLLKAILSVNFGSQHIVVIDGLDDILTGKEMQYKAIGSLIFQARRLNMHFAKNRQKIKIIILCRTDVFEKANNTNKNKIRQDTSVKLDWYRGEENLAENELVKLANARAHLYIDKNIDIFDSFFPKRINHTETIKHLLNHTRHTPRDFLQLMKSMQNFYNSRTLSENDVKEGVKHYSSEYFLPEIKDSLVGIISDKIIEQVFSYFGKTRSRELKTRDFINFIEEEISDDPDVLASILDALFSSCAIGNIQRVGRETRYSYKFRNQNSTFSINEDIMLHRGLWKALNLS